MRVRSPKRVCTRCETSYPASTEHFSPQKRGLFGLTSECKTCRSKKSNLYHVKNPYSRIAAQLKRKYGLTLDEWNAMFTAQNGCCAICGKHQSVLKRRLAVDHNHATGAIRQLLCQKCNHLLGHADEDLDILANARAYLQKHAL